MSYQSLTDDILVKLLKANDENAFKEIYERYWKEIFNTAYYRLANKETAKELVQSLFLRIWEKRMSSAINNLEGYLRSAIKNSIINYLASVVVQKKYAQFIEHTAANQVTPESLASYTELKNAIAKAINFLPEKTADVFRMSRFQHFSVKEIAAHLNISEKTVEYHITQSLKVMRLHLKEFLAFQIVISLFWVV